MTRCADLAGVAQVALLADLVRVADDVHGTFMLGIRITEHDGGERESHESGERVEVPFVDLAGFVHHHVGRRAPDQRVLMKMDIEGVELRGNQDFTARSC